MSKQIGVGIALDIFRKHSDDGIAVVVEKIQEAGKETDSGNWISIEKAPANMEWILCYDHEAAPRVRMMFYSPYGWLDRKMNRKKPFRPKFFRPLPGRGPQQTKKIVLSGGMYGNSAECAGVVKEVADGPEDDRW